MVIGMFILTVIQVTYSHTGRVAELAPCTFYLGKGIYPAVVHEIERGNISCIFIVSVFLAVVESCGKGEGLQSVFIDGFAQKGVGLAFYIVYVGGAFIITAG